MDISSALHVLSHELRGPTAVIQGYARLLSAGRVDPAASSHMLVQMQAAATRIAALGGEASAIARWLDPRVGRDESVLSLRELVERAVAASGTAASVAGLLQSSASMPNVRTLDPDALVAAMAAVIRTVARELPAERVAIVTGQSGPDHSLVTIGAEAEAHQANHWPDAPVPPALLSQGGLGLSLVLASVVFTAHGAEILCPHDRPRLIGLRMPNQEALAS